MSKNSYKELWGEKKYIQDLIANVISRFGDSVDAIAYSWIMYEVTENASLIAFILALNFIPTVFFQPFLAVLVERMEKRKVIVITSLGRGAIVLSTMFLYLSGDISSGYLMAATLLTSTLEAFSLPAGNAFVPKLIPMEKMAVAKGLSTSASTLAELAGTALAGSIIAFWGTHTALLIDVITFVFSACLIWFIPYKEQIEKTDLTMDRYRSDLKGGFSYLRSNRILIGIIVIGMSINLINVPFSSFQSVYVADYLQLDAQALSVFGTVLTIGMFLGSMFAPKLGGKFGMRKGIVISGILFSPFYIMGTFLPSLGISAPCIYILASAGMFCQGAGTGMVSVLFSTAFIKNVEQSYLARVSGITNSLLMSMMPVMGLICSFLAIFFKVTVIFFLVGIINLIFYFFVGKAEFFGALDEEEIENK